MNEIGGQIREGEGSFGFLLFELGSRVCFTTDNKCKNIFYGNIMSMRKKDEKTLCEISLDNNELLKDVPIDALFSKPRHINSFLEK